MADTADVVVIGGGVNGSSAAFHLAKRGIGRVVLLEKGHIASGPTGRSSGVVRQHYTTRTLAEMARDSVKVFHDFANVVGGDAGFVPCGVVFLSGHGDAATLGAAVKEHQQIGIRESLLSGDDLRRLEPQLFLDDVACGAYDRDGGYADPALAANSFADAAKRAGVDVRKRTTVTGLVADARGIQKVVTDKGEIATRAVVNAAGPWGRGIAAMVGVDIPMTVTRHPVVVLQRPAAWRTPTEVWGDLVGGWYFKPDGVAGIMVGSVQDDHTAVDIDTHNDTATHEEVVNASSAILHRFPIMEEGLAQKGWAGLYDVTPDSQPVIDRVAGVDGFVCAVGFSGHGFKISPAVGRIVSELVVDGRCTSYDIGLFRHDRFARGELHPGGYHYGIIG